jgi:hypothetical protein
VFHFIEKIEGLGYMPPEWEMYRWQLSNGSMRVRLCLSGEHVKLHTVMCTCVTSSMWESSKQASCFELLQSHSRTYSRVT